MDIQKEKEEIIKEVMKLNESITDEVLKNASKEDLLKYLELIDKIKIGLTN